MSFLKIFVLISSFSQCCTRFIYFFQNILIKVLINISLKLLIYIGLTKNIIYVDYLSNTYILLTNN